MALAFSIAPAAQGWNGSELLVTFPFISYNAPKWVSWVFWFAWLAFYLVSEVVTSGSAIIVMIARRGESKYMTKIDQFRIAVFAILFFQTALAGLILRFWEEIVDFSATAETWLTCLLKTGLIPNSPTCVPAQVPIEIFWWSLITFSMIGIYVFLCFGISNPRVAKAWCIGFKNRSNGDSFFKPPVGYTILDDDPDKEEIPTEETKLQKR